MLNVRGYSGTCVAKVWGSFTKTLSFCIIMQGPMLPINTCDWLWHKSWVLQITLPTVPILHPVISICLKNVRRTQVTKNFRQTQTSSYLSPLGNRHLTLIHSTPGYRPWCHGRANAFTPTVTGLMCIICYLRAMYTLMLQPCTL